MGRRIQGIARWAVGHATAAMCLVALSSHSAAAQGDSFVQQRDAEATKNASTGFSISFADDRRTFHPGETIKLVFTFRRHDVSPHNYEHCRGLGGADAVLDHYDGVADPQADFWTNGITRPLCDLLSGIMSYPAKRTGSSNRRARLSRAVA